MKAMRKTQAEIEAIIAEAKEKAEPYIKVMQEIALHTTPTAILKSDGSFEVKYSHDTNPTYIIAKGMAQSYFDWAQKMINE